MAKKENKVLKRNRLRKAWADACAKVIEGGEILRKAGAGASGNYLLQLGATMKVDGEKMLGEIES